MIHFNPKKARNQQRKNDVIVNATLDAVKGIRKWKLSSRIKFASWLLWGRGDWKGVK